MPTYAIRHHTQYRYSASISESVMEARMQPRMDGGQALLTFRLTASPSAPVHRYTDHLGNTVHWFTVPGRHGYLTIRVQSLVEVEAWDLPRLDEVAESWEALAQTAGQHNFWPWLAPSHFARPSPALAEFARQAGIDRAETPLATLRLLNQRLYDAFDYAPDSTSVDSPIEVALTSRQGVCQDYTHIFIALARSLGIPCRYVSGYLFHRADRHDRSAQDASHAWAEAFVPGVGWIGFDPTNNLYVHGRHIRVAIGRDYADVPPTKGVFRGSASSDLDVGVEVTLAERPAPQEELIPATGWTPPEDVGGQQQSQQ